MFRKIIGDAGERPEFMEKFSSNEIISGILVVCGWDDSLRAYNLKIGDQHLNLGNDREIARIVFEIARGHILSGKKLQEVISELEDYLLSLDVPKYS